MFVPPYDVLLRHLGLTREELDKQAQVTIPAKVLKFLLQREVRNADFNEKGYLASNTDVADAIRKKQIASARDHYVSFGYFECRRGATPEVDEGWYVRSHPDAAAALRKKVVTSAVDHYERYGLEEFRPPNEASQDDVYAWKAILAGKPKGKS